MNTKLPDIETMVVRIAAWEISLRTQKFLQQGTQLKEWRSLTNVLRQRLEGWVHLMLYGWGP
jgi:hypothetical protein